jgi:hypothetical protein
LITPVVDETDGLGQVAAMTEAGADSNRTR